MSNRRVDNKLHVRNLETSENAIGQLYPVLRDAEGKVIDGYHRLDVNPNWKSVTLKDVKTEEDRLIISAHVNLVRRNIFPKEVKYIINSLAEIYYQQGLRPDSKIQGIGKDGRKFNSNFNEIKYKLGEVLEGILSKEKIRKYLDAKYLNQNVAEGNKKYYEKRRKGKSAYSLLKSSHGNQLKKIYGDNFFIRLEREMLNKGLDEAKKFLRTDKRFRNEIEKEIKILYNKSIRQIVADTENKLKVESIENIEIRTEKRLRKELKQEYRDLIKEIKEQELIKAKAYLRRNREFRNELKEECRIEYNENIRIIIKKTEDSLRNRIRAEVETELNGMVVNAV